MATTILAVNAGSSSIKAGIFEADRHERFVAGAYVSGIGTARATMLVRAPESRDRVEHLHGSGHRDAVDAVTGALAPFSSSLSAVVHRVVHGGIAHVAPERVTPALLADLDALRSLAPDHLPQAIDAIQQLARAYPAVLQFACFDTAFHHRLPEIATLFPLPRRYADAGIRRYGFHGLSCEWVLAALGDEDPAAARGRMVVAHLGSGCSLTAVRDGVSVDTTMGFTPLGGVMMGTRTGDLDPGVMLHLLESEPARVAYLLKSEAGLLGVSGRTADMRELLESERADPQAARAVALFCYLARKALGGLVAVLGGLDTIVFTGGIGEHAAPVRARICELPAAFGLVLDEAANTRHASTISSAASAVAVRVVPADEERIMVRHARRLLSR